MGFSSWGYLGGLGVWGLGFEFRDILENYKL